jgi:ribosomal protein S18 acetylase RimI-like enzyme
MQPVVVRAARAADAPGMAAVHVRSWQETYRGLMPDAVLDRPDAAQRRERWWRRVIEGAEGTQSVAVAEHAHSIVGIASAGVPHDEDATWPLEVFVLYLLADFHGTGAGARLLEAIVADSPAALWVADENARARAFYLKHGFRPDGSVKDVGVAAIRMVRAVATLT